ncbi:MAG: hypothetical protein JXK07_04725 [Spirochaetes bacterium]|nr:hypothetical protein [Spirochaetota bacterium]
MNKNRAHPLRVQVAALSGLLAGLIYAICEIVPYCLLTAGRPGTGAAFDTYSL